MSNKRHPSFVTTMSSIGGPKAVLMSWEEDLDSHTPYMTGPGMKSPKEAKAYAEEWAIAEGIECK